MAAVDERTDLPPAPTTSGTTARGAPVPALAVAGVCSLAAGAIHAVAVGTHAAHRQAQLAFTVVALFQICWGALALVRPSRRVAALGVVGGLAAVSGWLLAKASGIGFVDGLDQAEPVRFADGVAAALAAVGVAGAVAALSGLGHRLVSPRVGPAVTAVAGATALAVAAWGMAATGGLVAGGHGDHAAAGHDEPSAGHGDAGHEATPEPVPFDPTRPIDLSGTPGVSPEEQAQAENLLTITLDRLPRFADPATAEAAGFRSIGDAATGDEHLVNWAYIDDEHILDPDYPEALVYRVQGGQRTLEAAMFMLRTGDTLADVPHLGGELMQWHIHTNLCFTADPAGPRLRGVTGTGEPCPAGLTHGPEMPMLHVWIVPQRCGPFAALDGIGAGQIAEGEERLCDTAHGSHGT